ncbi:MAG: peptidoglycan D,D-transpeptidase FtsI family protein, partial [Bacilli bacterium]
MQPKKKGNVLPMRLNIFFILIFLLLTVLVFRLGVLQIVYGQDYKLEVEKTEDVRIEKDAPRGIIYDRNGEVIVSNTPERAIMYVRPKSSSQDSRYELAQKLSAYLTMDVEKITERDLKDYWMFLHPDETKELISKSEMLKFQEKELTNAEIDDIRRERISEKMLDGLSEKDLQVLAIKREMDSAHKLTPQIIKKGVTEKEYAQVSEHLEELPDIDVTTEWERNYPHDELMRMFVGNITDTNEGLPAESIDYFLARGYARNDRVGKSYLEAEYEEMLRGQKEQVKNETDKSGTIIDQEIVKEGSRGNDLYLTLDLELQKEVEKIVEEEVMAARKASGGKYIDRGFIVMMNPKTGEIYSLVGKQLVKKDGKMEFVDYSIGTFTSSYPMGSVVKGATVMAALEEGIIRPGEVMYDSPLSLAGLGKTKGSWKNFGPVDDLTALEVSSNVYMFKIAIRALGLEYYSGMGLPMDLEKFQMLRNYYAQFGLGVKTGFDFANESTGFKGSPDNPGLLLDLTIGQFDTYTTLQLAQYVSTIANDGYRVKPQIISQVRTASENEEPGELVMTPETEVLNKVDVKDEYIKRVQEGFRRAMQGGRGTGRSFFASSSHNVAGKTGTAQTFYDGPERANGVGAVYVENQSLIGYAPFDNPEIAFAVVVPWSEHTKAYKANMTIGQRALNKYFELKEN